jgi:inhibitor of KinA sporulation pathway (predicted exonuclease)
MKLMSLDLEMNQPSGSIIEIGAATIDCRTGNILGTFHTHVDPDELISGEITTLTGITDQDTKGAPRVSEAYRLLEAFHSASGAFMNPLVWGSGDRNDSNILWNQAKCQDNDNIGKNFMGRRVIDVKDLCQSRSARLGDQMSGGLASHVERYGLGWDHAFGEPHRALADAHNTARLWWKISDMLRERRHVEYFGKHLAQGKSPKTYKGFVGVLAKERAELTRRIAALIELEDYFTGIEGQEWAGTATGQRTLEILRKL